MTDIVYNYPKSLKNKKEMVVQHYSIIKFIPEIRKIENILKIAEESIPIMGKLEHFKDTNKYDWEIGFLKKKK